MILSVRETSRYSVLVKNIITFSRILNAQTLIIYKLCSNNYTIIYNIIVNRSNNIISLLIIIDWPRI